MTEDKLRELNEELCDGVRNTLEALQTGSDFLARTALDALERADMATPEDCPQVKEAVFDITRQTAGVLRRHFTL